MKRRREIVRRLMERRRKLESDKRRTAHVVRTGAHHRRNTERDGFDFLAAMLAFGRR